jgi:hypothetical protein
MEASFGKMTRMGEFALLAGQLKKCLYVAALSVSLCSTTAAHAQCKSTSFTAELQSGQKFSRTLGNGLTLLLRPSPEPTDPEGYPEQWTIEIHAAPLGKDALDPDNPDFIYPVNPPLRGNPWQFLGAVYGLTIKESLDKPRELSFLLTRQDSDRLSPILNYALWPYTSREPDKTTERYFEAVSKLKLGQLKFKVLDYQVSEPVAHSEKAGEKSEEHRRADDRIITSLKFEVQVIVPSTFEFHSGLKATPAACPKPIVF